MPHRIVLEIDRTLAEANGVNARLEVFANERLNMSAILAACDVGAEDMPDPAIRPRAVQRFSNQWQLALADEFIGPIHVPVAFQNVLPNIGELQLLPGVLRELREEVVESDLGDRAEIPLRETE
jgi:hypothetical protein